MNQKNTKIERVLQNGFLLEFGIVFEKAFENYKKIALIGGVVYLLIGLVFFGIAMGLVGLVAGATSFMDFATSFNLQNFSSVGIIIYIVVASLVSGITYPINAGLLNLAHLAEQKKDFEIGDAFVYFKNKYLKELFLAGFIITLVASGLNLLFEFSGIIIVGTLLNYFILFLTILTIPLIIFSELNAFEAIQTSLKLVFKSPFTIFGLLFVSYILAFLGFIGFCIGILFTLPFVNSILYHIYIGILPIKEHNEIDEIGINQE